MMDIKVLADIGRALVGGDKTIVDDGTNLSSMTMDAVRDFAANPLLVGTADATTSWTTEAGLVVNVNDCVITPTATEDEWPIGVARLVVSPIARAFSFAVPSGHDLNDVTDGESPWFGDGVAADDKSIPAAWLLRESATTWSWFAPGSGSGGGAQTVSDPTGTISEGVSIVGVLETGGTCELTMPTGVAGQVMLINVASGVETDITLTGGLINNSGSDLELPANGYAGHRLILCACVAPGFWEVEVCDAGVLLSIVTGLSSDVSGLDSRVLSLESIQVVTTATDTINSSTRLVLVKYAAGNCTLTAPAAIPDQHIVIAKIHSAVYSTRVIRSGTDTVDGLTTAVTITGTDLDISGTSYPCPGSISCVTSGAWIQGNEGFGHSAYAGVVGLSSGLSAVGSRVTDLENGLVGSVQIVSTATATVTTAEDVYVTYSAGAVTLTMPNAAARRLIRIHKCHTADFDIEVKRSASDISGSGTIDGFASSYYLTGKTRTGMWTLSGQAALTWQIDDNTYAIRAVEAVNATQTARLNSIESGITPSANIRNITSGTTATILAGETLVRQGSANAMALTLPPALIGTEIDVVKDTTNAGAITLIRAGSDTIHGSASNYVLDGSTYVTSATTYRRRWTISCLVAGEWTVT